MAQEYTQKYTVVCFFDAQNAPAKFSALDWPLHVTMLVPLATLQQKPKKALSPLTAPSLWARVFLPHATDQKDNRVDLGQTYHLTNTSLIDMFPSGEHMQRSIVETFPFGGFV